MTGTATARDNRSPGAAHLPPVPDLPAVRGGGAARRGHRVSTPPDRTWPCLVERADRLGVPPDALLVAAFAEVVRDWCGSDDFVLGVRGADGTRALPVRCDGEAFADRVRSVHRALPDAPPATGELPVALAFGDVEGTSGALLDVHVSEVDGRVRFDWRSRDDVLAPGVAEDMAEAFDKLLAILAGDGNSPIMPHFPLLPEKQARRRAEVNDTAAPPPDTLLHLSVAEHARVRPDAPAVITSTRVLTYREFSRRVNQVGRVLRGAGVRPGRLVAVVMAKGWEQVVAVHGVLAAGGAYLPIDHEVPPERLRSLLSSGEADVVLTQSAVRSAVEWPDDVRPLCVDRDFDDADDADLDPVQSPDDLAYVVFTSGSTGVPKGVMVDHRGALNTIADVNTRLGIGPGDRCVAVSGLHFDLAVYDMFGLTAAGGAVVLPDPAPRPDPGHWSRLVERAGVTFWNSVPALAEMLVTHTELTRAAGRLDTLRLAVLSGDRIPVTLPDRLRAVARNARVVAAGGPAETCVWSIAFPLDGPVPPTWTSIPYGTPMTNQRYHVLDARSRPRPVWVPGEIHVESDVGLARGYWRDPVRTAEVFRTLPAGGRCYATGDVGRYLPDGNIEILGRTDFQVKVQGVRIEPGEIEAAMTAHPAVREAVVVAGGAADLPVLHGFFAWRDGEPPGGVADLRESLRRALPAALVPPALVALDRLPLTRNGKVDRLALAAQARAAAAPTSPRSGS